MRAPTLPNRPILTVIRRSRHSDPAADDQSRARDYIARDVRDYAEKAPVGLVIESQTITKVAHRCGRNEAPHPDCGPRHEFPREAWKRRRRTDETPWQEAHRY